MRTVQSRNLVRNCVTATEPAVFLNKKQAAEFLGIAQRTLCSWMERRLISYRKIGRTVRFHRAELEQAGTLVVSRSHKTAALINLRNGDNPQPFPCSPLAHKRREASTTFLKAGHINYEQDFGPEPKQSANPITAVRSERGYSANIYDGSTPKPPKSMRYQFRRKYALKKVRNTDGHRGGVRPGTSAPWPKGKPAASITFRFCLYRRDSVR